MSNKVKTRRINSKYSFAISRMFRSPRTPVDFFNGICIGRTATSLRLKLLERKYQSALFLKGVRRVRGRSTRTYQAIEAASVGSGLTYIPEELARPYIENGNLQVVLNDWAPSVPGLHIFYANHRQSSPALSLIVGALRLRR
ncbi:MULTISPECIES: LysR substrate-binding domain-containing protein [unclassified Pseudomonas]|jgi:DNA-binding transcriptional LysR family regulator|uniref:LysR substrate-binding domain-containing protein n=1 Tax=Pseudomonas sp. 43mfcvi1.1 TaxID=1761894 RepID=UPI000D6D191A